MSVLKGQVTHFTLPFQGAERKYCLVPGTMPRVELYMAFSHYSQAVNAKKSFPMVINAL